MFALMSPMNLDETPQHMNFPFKNIKFCKLARCRLHNKSIFSRDEIHKIHINGRVEYKKVSEKENCIRKRNPFDGLFFKKYS